LTTQNQETIRPETQVDETAKRLFVEPEISGPVDVLETTAFFQLTTGGTDTTGDIT
jgi:hypothetical protein